MRGMQNKNLFLLSFPNASNFIEDKVRKINKSLKTLEKSNQQKTLHKTIKEAAETFYCYIPNVYNHNDNIHTDEENDIRHNDCLSLMR
jgi:hypothetical protein